MPQDPSEPVPAPLVEPALLQAFCRHANFQKGEVLRTKGQHYRDMYVLTSGHVAIDREMPGAAVAIRSGAGCPIGEIGFLTGNPASATVVAQTAVEAIVIDEAALAELERQQPSVAAQLWRRLAEIAEDRTSENQALASWPVVRGGSGAIQVYLCRSQQLLHSAQRLRYDVYCGELGRHSPNADHDKKIISDDLDRFGHTFVAIEAGETIGTLRANLPCEGPLGVLEELYGMKRSPLHPRGTAVCTKLIVKKAKRGSPAALKMIAAVVRFGRRDRIMECYADCTPPLLPYYKALGFRVAGPKFFHRENGPSYPLVLDLAKHGARLGRDYGWRGHLQLYLKAKMIKFIDRLRGERAFLPPP